MAATPEAKVKKMVKDVLKKYAPIYAYWPVPMGYGPSSLDCLVCALGKFVSIETKAPGKKPTPAQALTIADIHAAHGIALVIDGPEGVAFLDQVLGEIYGTSDRLG